MKFTLSWLRAHLDTEASLDRIATVLSAIGLEVEGITDAAAPLAAFRTATILTATQHPNADRLRVCEVDIGAGAPVQVVCGAPNARAGLATIFAPPGATIPASGTVLKVGEIRGVESRGMLCSLRELRLGEEHDGIAELPGGTAPGQNYARVAGLDDPLIEIAVTPNRGDALAIRGIARDLAAAGLGTLRPLPPASIAPAGPSRLAWTLEDREGCPWVLGRTIGGLRNGPSPDWLRARLASVGARSINALVDVTNFFAIDRGRPLHVFDADRVAGDTLVIRRGRPGESFAGLNGQTIAVTPDDCVIADAAGVQSLAGIMGGSDTGSTDATTTVFVECALFDPVRIATSGRRLGLASDARARFERGIDQSALRSMLDDATAMILELCGGTASGIAEAGAEPGWRRTATLRYDRLRTLGGITPDPALATARLASLGFAETARDDASLTVAVPPWRNDVAGALPYEPLPGTALDPALQRAAAEAEAEADLVEEILRLGGLDAVPPVSLPRLAAVPLPSVPEPAASLMTVRRGLAGRGFLECVSFSFMDGARARAMTPDLAPAQVASLTLVNPIASDLDRLRPTPLASLLEAAARNAARGEPDQALFEIGPGFSPAGPETIAAALRTGHTPRHPGHPATPVGWQAARADLLAMLAILGVPPESITTEPVDPTDPVWHPGRAGHLKQGPKTVLGTFGALHPTLADAFDLAVPAVAMTLFPDRVRPPKRRRRAAPVLSPLMPVRRDFAFVVDAALPAEKLIRAAAGADRALIAAVAPFDVYAGDRLPAGKKSLAIEVTLQPRDATLTDREIETVSAAIVAAVAKATGGVLR